MVAQTVTPTLKGVLKNWVVAYPDDDTPAARLREIEAELRKIDRADGSHYFGFERAEEQLEKAKTLLEREKTHLLMKQKGFLELDLDFLEWRKNPLGFPAFAIIALDPEEGEFRITVSPDYDERDEYTVDTEPELPEAIEDRFEGVFDYLNKKARKNESDEISISCEVEGFINDDDLRKKVNQIQESGTFDEMFVIAEAKGWKVEETKYLKGDPLIVGWVEDTDQMFLVADFDLTPLEEHIKINFAY